MFEGVNVFIGMQGFGLACFNGVTKCPLVPGGCNKANEAMHFSRGKLKSYIWLNTRKKMNNRYLVVIS